VAALALAVPPAEPPRELRGRVLAATRRRAPVVPLRRVLAGAVALAAAAVLALGLQHAFDHGAGTRTVALAGVRGSLVVQSDGRARLLVHGLPAARPGRTYEAWIIDRNGAIPAALFRGGASLTIALLFRRVPHGARVAVTEERAGGVARLRGTPLFGTAGAA
jgi:hypothetical protein